MGSTSARIGSLVAALVLTLGRVSDAAAQPVALDPALCQPGFAAFAGRYPNDWYQRLHPAVRPIADVQRMIGLHGLVVAFADEEPNPTYTNPRVVVVVAFHDGADLHAAGLPRVWPNGKPVVVLYTPGIPQAAAAPGSPTAQRSAAQLPAGCPAAWAGTAAGRAPGTDQPSPPSQLPRTGAGGAGEFALAGLLLVFAGWLLGDRRRSHRSPPPHCAPRRRPKSARPRGRGARNRALCQATSRVWIRTRGRFGPALCARPHGQGSPAARRSTRRPGPAAELTALVFVAPGDRGAGLSPLDASLAAHLDGAYADHGLRLLERRPATAAEGAAAHSTWSKRLGARPSWLLRVRPATTRPAPDR